MNIHIILKSLGPYFAFKNVWKCVIFRNKSVPKISTLIDENFLYILIVAEILLRPLSIFLAQKIWTWTGIIFDWMNRQGSLFFGIIVNSLFSCMRFRDWILIMYVFIMHMMCLIIFEDKAEIQDQYPLSLNRDQDRLQKYWAIIYQDQD